MGISRSDQTLSDQETDIEVPTVNIDQPTPRPVPFDPYMSYKESAIDESMKSRLLQKNFLRTASSKRSVIVGKYFIQAQVNIIKNMSYIIISG